MRPSEELAKYAIHVLALAQMLLLGSLSLSLSFFLFFSSVLFCWLQICQQLISKTPQWQMSTSSIRPVTSAKQIAFSPPLYSFVHSLILRYFFFTFNFLWVTKGSQLKVKICLLWEIMLVGCLEIALSSITSKLRCPRSGNIFWTWGPHSPNILPNMPVHLLLPNLCGHFDALKGVGGCLVVVNGGVGWGGRNEILSIYIMGLTHMAQCVPHWRHTRGTKSASMPRKTLLYGLHRVPRDYQLFTISFTQLIRLDRPALGFTETWSLFCSLCKELL